MAEKFDRKKLKEPDEFVSFTQRALEWAIANRVMLIAGALGMIVLIVAIFGFRWYTLDVEKKASAAFIKAHEIYEAPVVSNPEQALSGKTAKGTYASPAEKYEAALKGFEDVEKKHGGSQTAMLARYYIGECQLRMGKFDEAIKSFESYLKDAGPESALAGLAVEGMAAAYEGKGEAEQARKQYERLTAEPFEKNKARGLYHLARLEAVSGKKEQAARMFMELQRDYPESAFAREAAERLTVLPKVELPEAPAPKKEEPQAEAQPS